MKKRFARFFGRKPILVVRALPMPDAELTAAFSIGSAHPFYRGILQLIDTAEANARMLANAHIENHAKLAGYTAGAEHLAMLRDEIEGRRALALAAMRQVSPAG